MLVCAVVHIRLKKSPKYVLELRCSLSFTDKINNILLKLFFHVSLHMSISEQIDLYSYC